MAGRIELKYLIGYEQKAQLLALWRPYLEAAPHTDDRATYPIMSLYFDSPSLTFYDEKLDGEKERSKVRLRGYGYDWRSIAPCFLEVKRKDNSRLVKLRKNMGPFRRELWDPEQWELGEGPQEAPVAMLARRLHLRPAAQILYQREAYESPFCPRLRLAFDSRLIALHPDQELRREMFDDPAHRCLGDTRFICEIKSDGGLPPWVYDGIYACQLEQRSISKYVLGIERLNLHNREVGVYA